MSDSSIGDGMRYLVNESDLVEGCRRECDDSISVVGVVVVRTCGPLAAPLPLFDVDGPGPGVPSLPPVRGHNGVDVVLDLD